MRTPHLRTALTSAEVAQALTEAAALIRELTDENQRLRSAGATAKAEMERQHAQIARLQDQVAEQWTDENAAYNRLLRRWHLEHSAKLEAQREARTQAAQLQTCRETIKNLRAMSASADKTIRELRTEIQSYELGGM